MTTIQALKELGEQLGLEGTDLRDFVKEQQYLEREERTKEREEREKQRDFEKEKQDREMQLRRMEFEIEMKKLETSVMQEGLNDSKEDVGHTVDIRGRRMAKGPKMPCFDESKDDMDSFLHRFEIYADSQGWLKDQWAVYLSALLKGRALEVYSRLPVKEAQNYDILKDALLKRFNLTEEGFKQKFKSAKPENNEAPAQFLARLENYLMRWIELANVEKDFEGLKNLVVREQYLESCSVQLAIFLRERKPKDLDELASIAEQYLEAHANKNVTRKVESRAETSHEKKFGSSVTVNSASGYSHPVSKTCFNCGKAGHISRNCFQKPKKATLNAMETSQNYRGGYRKPMFGRGSRSPQRNFNIRSDSSSCQLQTSQKDIDSSIQATQGSAFQCKTHQRQMCELCIEPVHKCNAALHSVGSEVIMKCGCSFPVIADACQSYNRNMPVQDGMLGGHKVSVLRDSGCSTVVVKRSLVKDDQLTGAEETCVLIDGTVRRVPVAEIEIDTPYYSGQVKAVCMRNPLYDVIIGNIPGVKEEGDLEKVQAVMTRSQIQKENKPTKPLKVVEGLDISVGRDNLVVMQHEDKCLRKLFEKAAQEEQDDLDVQFKIKNGILYRLCKTFDGRDVSQVVLPIELRERILKLAHEAVMSGHQGRKKTKDRIWNQFWWPGLNADVTRFCRSCDICQRTVAKGKVANVPLGKMPVIDTPFDRVAVDIVGPIQPVTDKKNRYILTLVDYATRYPEAEPMKDIHAETVAETLVNMFTRVGIPREILSDQGSQFMSAVMKEVCRLLSVKQLVTTPYHPMCNGLVEKFNGTLKNMLRRMCAEKPKDWDRYIGALLFAYREVRQESLGYAPFELLYGRTVRGPMSIMRELLTSESVEPEVKTTYEYVVDLKERLEDTCEMAHKELAKAQNKQSKYYNRKVKSRIFQAGDKVLVLLPTDSNKLLMQWQGPFTVLERVRGDDYKIRLSGRTSTYHANMLKKYWEREAIEKIDNEDNVSVPELSAVVVETNEEVDDEIDLYREQQSETYKDVKISEELSEAERKDVMDLLDEFQDIFTDVPGLTTLGEHSITLTTDDPIHSKPYPIPHAMQDVVEKELETMLSLGIIEPSTSAYASPIVIVKKPDGSNRVCVDFRKVNKVTIFDPEPMPQPEQIFAKLQKDRYFSTFDVTKGFWQIPMRASDKPYTAFVTHRGLHQFRVMPFGLVNAPATFNRLMRKLLLGNDSLDNYVDDVLAHTVNWQYHICALRDFFGRVREAHLTLRPSKCFVGFPSVPYLGHTIGNHKLETKAEMVNKILQAPRPVDKKQLRSFLGLVGYYRKFIPNFAALAVPLTDLTKKGTPNQLTWTEPQERAFQALRSHIACPPVLSLPDFGKEFILQTDACNDGVGGVLFQEEAGVKHPVAFASKKLLPRERNYSTIEKECLAIVWAVQKFQNFLYGKPFVLETDHQPLQYLGKAQFQNGRLMRWALALQPYRFTIKAIKGSENIGADFLSRHVAE